MGVLPDLMSAVKMSTGGVIEDCWRAWGGKKSVLTHRSRCDLPEVVHRRNSFVLYSQFSGVNTIQYKLLLDIDTNIPQNLFSTPLRGSFVLVGASKALRTLNLRQHAHEVIASFWAELEKEYLPDESKWTELTRQEDFLKKFT